MLSGKQDFHSSFGKKGMTVQVVQRGICKCVMQIWKFSQKNFWVLDMFSHCTLGQFWPRIDPPASSLQGRG